MENASIVINYFFLIGIGGFFVMLILSTLAFCNVESFEIPKGKHYVSGSILLFGSIFYGAVAIGLYIWTIKKGNDDKKNIQAELMLNESMEHNNNIYNYNSGNNINTPSDKSKSDEDEEDKKSDERLIDDD